MLGAFCSKKCWFVSPSYMKSARHLLCLTNTSAFSNKFLKSRPSSLSGSMSYWWNFFITISSESSHSNHWYWVYRLSFFHDRNPTKQLAVIYKIIVFRLSSFFERFQEFSRINQLIKIISLVSSLQYSYNCSSIRIFNQNFNVYPNKILTIPGKLNNFFWFWLAVICV